MKCSDLQTGNYVRCQGHIYIIEEVSAKGWVHLIHPETKVRVNMTSDYIINLLEPILLTPEILEKIGFNKVPQQGCLNPYFWMLKKYEEVSEGLLYCIKAYKTMFRGMYVSIDNYADCKPIKFSKQIEHAHELQNTLRICGLNDLADNFKLEEQIYD